MGTTKIVEGTNTMIESRLAMQPAPEDMMSGLIYGSEIEGAVLRTLCEHKDHRGSFTEFFRSEWPTPIEPVQWSVVRSEPNVFRGCHLHLRHDEFFCILDGTCLLGLKDIRPSSPTRGVSSLYRLHGADLAALAFPRGIVHGWYFFGKSTHVQAVSESYDDYGGDDNWGCRWNDPDLDLPWGVEDAILSDRAAGFPPLKQLMDDIGFTT